jgi:WD40 repeat protein
MRPDPLEEVVSTSPSNVNISFSPNGAELIVAVQCGRTMIARTDGSGVRELEGVMTNGEIEFGPTGGEIAFTPCDERSIDVVKADGTGLSHVAGPGAPLLYGAPAWSPDGSYLAYHVWDGTAPVWTVRTHIVGADGKGDRPLREVPEGDFDGLPAWSNDGKRIVISQGFDPVMYATVLPINGPNQGVRSTVPLVTGLACCSAFEWAPDDSFVLVMPIDDVSQPAQQMLLDPITGEMRPAPWTTTSPPSWQRLAP